VTGPHDSDLPPGRVRRGQHLLNGRIDPREAHPLELAWATKHILTHRDLSADAFRRSAEDRALAELHATFGNLPRLTFGSSALRAVVVAGPGECARCRANLIARVRHLSPPYRNAATNYLLGGEGCARCRPSPVRTVRPGGSVRPDRVRPLAALRDDVNRLLADSKAGDRWTGLPDDSALLSLRL
jgi:hypothetical protein